MKTYLTDCSSLYCQSILSWRKSGRQGRKTACILVKVTSPRHVDIDRAVTHLAKLSSGLAGQYAVTRLHGFQVAERDTRLRAHGLTILYDLMIDESASLGRGARMADDNAVRRRFGLDEDPEPWLIGWMAFLTTTDKSMDNDAKTERWHRLRERGNPARKDRSHEHADQGCA